MTHTHTHTSLGFLTCLQLVQRLLTAATVGEKSLRRLGRSLWHTSDCRYDRTSPLCKCCRERTSELVHTSVHIPNLSRRRASFRSLLSIFHARATFHFPPSLPPYVKRNCTSRERAIGMQNQVANFLLRVEATAAKGAFADAKPHGRGGANERPGACGLGTQVVHAGGLEVRPSLWRPLRRAHSFICSVYWYRWPSLQSLSLCGRFACFRAISPASQPQFVWREEMRNSNNFS